LVRARRDRAIWSARPESDPPLYAGLAIAVAGVVLVWALPALAGRLAPSWRSLLDYPLLLNILRLMTGFVLLLTPSIAMGATLPLLVKILLARDRIFGSVLGRLYAWNTLGAVFGAVSGEVIFLVALGVAGAAFIAAGSNLVAAFAAISVLRNMQADSTPDTLVATPSLKVAVLTWRPLLAAFFSGSIVLTLEVVWFRILELFVWNSGASFALMLAVVLAGMGLQLLRVRYEAHPLRRAETQRLRELFPTGCWT
jgi:spermidine synthase